MEFCYTDLYIFVMKNVSIWWWGGLMCRWVLKNYVFICGGILEIWMLMSGRSILLWRFYIGYSFQKRFIFIIIKAYLLKNIATLDKYVYFIQFYFINFLGSLLLLVPLSNIISL